MSTCRMLHCSALVIHLEKPKCSPDHPLGDPHVRLLHCKAKNICVCGAMHRFQAREHVAGKPAGWALEPEHAPQQTLRQQAQGGTMTEQVE
jgi:hypothetical protein